METQQNAATNLRCTLSISSGGLGRVGCDGVVSEDKQEVIENKEDQASDNRRTPRESLNTASPNSPPAVTPQTQSSESDQWTTNAKGRTELLERETRLGREKIPGVIHHFRVKAP